LPPTPDVPVTVRYLVHDVGAAVAFYAGNLGFTVAVDKAPVFAVVDRGNLRLILSGPTSSTGEALPNGRVPEPGGWNRIHLPVADVDAEVARLRAAGVQFRSDPIDAPGGIHVVLDDPSGNPIELFHQKGMTNV
jgi:catechol 2,3-dioxygenase-like lactoylglutathione lyase family enzyme